jgi:hypothetical protein
MYGLYTPVILLQAFCVYHAYRHNTEQRWYWIILFLPALGSALYLFDHYYNRRDIHAVKESIKGVVNNNYKIEELEKALQFSDNHTNRINLADAYVESGRYGDSIKLYQESLTGFMADDPAVRIKLLQAHFLNQDYTETIIIGKELESDKSFRNTEQRLGYAWALHYDGKTEAAEKVFQDMDRPFTNHQQRVQYCRFLLNLGRTDEVKTRLTELVEEFNHIRGSERKLYRDIIRETKDLYFEHVGSVLP